MVARELPLGPAGPQRYTVWFAPELEDELLDHANAEQLVDELEKTLRLESDQIPGRRIEKVKDSEDLLKYRPHAANDVRFIFAREQHYVVVLSMFPRKTDYRKKDIRTAQRRLASFEQAFRAVLAEDDKESS